jgi:probable F420-dependent oxidoreductase
MGREALLEFADALEHSGFDGVWLSDVPVAPLVDPLLGLALIAGRTSRVKLGANVVPLGRNPFLLAKDLAQLDQISGGRLLLSFVPGLEQPGEREVLGSRGADRGALLEESLTAVRAWWSGAQSAASDVAAATTRPLQDPLEVWLGGRGPRALERVGRIADGWLGAALTPAEAAGARERIQESAASAGREVDPEHFGLSVAYARREPSTDLLASLRARRTDVDPLALLAVGASGLRSRISGYVEAGLSKFVVRPAIEVASWEEEAAWLAEALLDMQT